VYVWCVTPSVLDFSLSSHRHTHVSLLFTSRSSLVLRILCFWNSTSKRLTTSSVESMYTNKSLQLYMGLTVGSTQTQATERTVFEFIAQPNENTFSWNIGSEVRVMTDIIKKKGGGIKSEKNSRDKRNNGKEGREGLGSTQGPDTLAVFVRNSKGHPRTRPRCLTLLRCSFQKE
jgi:hypothetical protein